MILPLDEPVIQKIKVMCYILFEMQVENEIVKTSFLIYFSCRQLILPRSLCSSGLASPIDRYLAPRFRGIP